MARIRCESGPSSRPLMRAVPSDGRDEAGQHAHRRRLAGAVRAEQAEDLAVAHRERQVVDGGQRPEVLASPIGLDHRCRMLAASIARSRRPSEYQFGRSPMVTHARALACDAMEERTLSTHAAVGRAHHPRARGRGRALRWAPHDARGRRAPRRRRHPGLGRRAAGDGAPVAARHRPGAARDPGRDARAGRAAAGDRAARAGRGGRPGGGDVGRGPALLHRPRLLRRADAPLPGHRPDGGDRRRRRGRGARAVVADPGRRAGGDRRRAHHGRQDDRRHRLGSRWHGRLPVIGATR